MHQAAWQCLTEASPQRKLELTKATVARLACGELAPCDDSPAAQSLSVPGRPAQPLLVGPREVQQRKLSTPEGRTALMHAVAHIEFNAINLAWDAVYRFRGMPARYYADWASVAADEARHFAMLEARLGEMGSFYGAFSAHNGLWEMALETEDDCLARMALVPRVLEARGLDVTPGMITRLRSVGDLATVAVLEVILREEVAHVEIGTRWFHYCCAQRGIDPEPTFENLLATRFRGRVKGPFNLPARYAAGFTESEMRRLAALAGSD